MADNQSRRADPALLENDPFAELTRIMGHDPRAAEPARDYHPVDSEAAREEDAFDIDLEKELMGELDFDEFDAPRDEHTEPQEGQDDLRPDQAADAFGDENVAPPAAEADASALDDPFGNETEPFDDPQAFEVDPEPLPFAAVEAAEPHREVEDDHQPALNENLSWEPQDDIHGIDEADFASAMEQELAGDEPAYEPVHETAHDADEQPAYEWRVDSAPPAGEAVDDGVTEADFDMDFGFIEDDVAHEASEPAAADETAFELPVAELPANETFEQDSFEPAAAASVQPSASTGSLEDELSALLQADEPVPATADEAPTATAADEASEPADAWHPGVNTFGHVDAAAFGPDEEEVAEEAPLEASERDEPAEALQDDMPAEPVQAEAERGFAAPVSMLDEDDFVDIFRDEDIASDDQPAQQEAAARPVAAAAAVAAPFVMRPVTTPVAPEPAHVPQVDVLASWRPQRAPVEAALAATPASVASGHEPPEVETIEVAEGPQPVADDLDIPDVDYSTSASAAGPYGDLESEIAQAFGDLSIEETDHSAQPAAPVAATAGWSTAPAAFAASQPQPPPQYVADNTDPVQDETVDAYAVGEGQWQSDPAYPDDGFDYGPEVEQAMAMSAFEDEPQQAAPARKRGVLVAAVVAGVAVVGGVGLFGMSLFGGGSDEPAVVLADTDPVKVRPENPGGTEVPNQDNQVYQRVSQGPSAVDPEQERLITTAEEPVDVTAAAEPPPALAPGVSEEPAEAAPATGDDTPALAADTATDAAPAQVAGTAAPEAADEPTAAAPQPKSEERIAAETTAPATTASEEVALVQPRRVRTMIVRPDGTMVPREEEPIPAPQETASVLSQPSVVDAPTLAPAGELVPAPGSEATAGEDGGSLVDTPETVAVVPSQPSRPTTSADQAPASAPQEQQAPEPTPVSAPAAAAPAAAATSEWSMQIASQPTAEGAQATYQDLARRYGSVLQGRGVNIVRADIQGMGVYYRVRIPAASRDEAIQLCTEYKSAGGSCFVSR